MAAPTAFSAALEKWLFEKSKGSIFFIQITPNLKFKVEIQDHMEKANTILKNKREEQLNKHGHCCTGFVVEANATEFKILTSAHTIGHVFSAAKPISLANANKFFRTHVLCDHYESSFRQPGHTHTQRVYSPAKIIGLSCQKDLMLIAVERKDVKDLTKICNSEHPPLACSLFPPTAFDECIMISWPPLRHRSTAKGSISHPSRTMDESGLLNPAGYRMNVIQVQMESEDGSSGAPLLNGAGNVIGVLHGGFGRSFSYFVSLGEIAWFLMQHGVMTRQDF